LAALAGGEPAREVVLMLFDEVADLGERLERLERRLGQNSVNSSLPPSSDRGQGPKRPARKRSERKQGAQLGHEGVSRTLADGPDETLAVRRDASQVWAQSDWRGPGRWSRGAPPGDRSASVGGRDD
jgi:hypothetical protein